VANLNQSLTIVNSLVIRYNQIPFNLTPDQRAKLQDNLTNAVNGLNQATKLNLLNADIKNAVITALQNSAEFIRNLPKTIISGLLPDIDWGKIALIGGAVIGGTILLTILMKGKQK
jgi:F0F1-type ATP synthase beta subunit